MNFSLFFKWSIILEILISCPVRAIDPEEQLTTRSSTPIVAYSAATDSPTTDTPTSQPDYNCTGNRICVRKCCPKGSLMDIQEGCVDVELYNLTSWSPSLRLEEDSELVLVDEFLSFPKEPKFENFVCPFHEDDEFRLCDDGSVFHKKRKETFSHDLYCIDHTSDDGKLSVGAAICYERIEKTRLQIVMDYAHFSALCLSAAFLALLLVVHLLSVSKKDLQVKCTISSCVSLFFGYILLIVNYSSAVNLLQEDMCVALAISMQFFLLSFYFWLNIMCYEISRIIRGTMRLQSYKELTKSKWRYLVYSLYSYGVPLAFCFFTLTIQYLPPFSEGVEKYLVRPGIAEGHCWFKEEGGGVYAYYYVFEVTLSIANACLMGSTAWQIYRDKLQILCCRKAIATTQLRTHSTTNYLTMFKHQLTIFLMYLSIWIMNTISLIYSHSTIWRFGDCVVSCQGVFLFFIVTAPKKFSLLSQALERVSSSVRGFSHKVSIIKIRLAVLSDMSSSQNEESPL